MSIELSPGNFGDVDGTTIDYDDPEWMHLTKAQLANLDHQVLRRYASQANGPVNGKSTKLEFQAYFCVQKSLDEYE